MNSPVYRRLPTPQLGWLTFSRVYVGSDHVLVVDCSGFEERYRRFKFSDIQAVLIRHSARGRVLNFVLGLFGILTLVGCVAAASEGRLILGILSGLIFTVLLINVFRGPTAAVVLQTRVQLHPIKAFSRVHGTKRALQELTLLIQAAQSTESLTADPAVSAEPPSQSER